MLHIFIFFIGHNMECQFAFYTPDKAKILLWLYQDYIHRQRCLFQAELIYIDVIVMNSTFAIKADFNHDNLSVA